MNRTLSRFALAANICVFASCTDTTVISYPQTTTTFEGASPVPLGADAKGDFVESRFQQLIPAGYLPLGEVDWCRFVPRTGGTVEYVSLRIRFSHTSASSLSDDFDKNLPNPVTVHDQSNFSIDWKAGVWNQDIATQTSFVLDGKRNLVFEIIKVAKKLPSNRSTVAMAVSSNPGRTDLPAAKFTVGTGASRSQTANNTMRAPLQVGLRFRGSGFFAPPTTLNIRSDRGTAGSRNVFALGENVVLSMAAGRRTSQKYLLFAGSTLNSRPVHVPGINGALIIAPIVEVLGSGRQVQFGIPKTSALIGGRFVFQALVEWSLTSSSPPLGVSFTNAVDCIVRQ